MILSPPKPPAFLDIKKLSLGFRKFAKTDFEILLSAAMSEYQIQLSVKVSS